MSPSRFDATFDSTLVDSSASGGPVSAVLAGFADLHARLSERLARHTAGVEFALIAFWALTPFAFALLIS